MKNEWEANKREMRSGGAVYGENETESVTRDAIKGRKRRVFYQGHRWHRWTQR
jgi:hypothetical protein